MSKDKWTMPTKESDVAEIKKAIDATYSVMERINEEKGNMTDIFQEIHAKYGIPRRVFNFLARVNYYGNANAVKERAEELTDAWETIQK